MRTYYLVLLSTLCFFVGYSQNQYKKDTVEQKINYLNEVIITGNRMSDPILSVESPDYVKKVVQPRNVADLFAGFTGFSLIKRGNYAIDPSFRASQYEQLNLQFDGGTKVMHACPNRMDPVTTHVIPEEIEKIEVIKGPYSVRYGATFGAIVNLVTKKEISANKGLHGSLSSGGESNGLSTVTNFAISQTGESYSIQGNFGYRDFGNFEDGDGTEIPSSFRSLDYGLKGIFDLSDNQKFKVNWRQSFGRDVLHAGLPMDTDLDNSSIVSLDYKWTGMKGLIKEMNTKVYYSYVDHIMSNARRPSFNMVEAISEIDATTAGGKLELTMNPVKNLTLYTGIDAQLIARDGNRVRLVKRNMAGVELPEPVEFTDKIWQDSNVNDYGFFVESKYAISSKTLATLGLRTDVVISDINDPEADFEALYPNLGERTENNFSGTVSLKHEIFKNHLLEFAYGRGVRSANMIERFINHFTVGQDPFEYVGNPNLSAEVNNQFEVGMKGQKDLSGSDVLKYGASVFYSNYENYIVPVIDPDLSRKYMPNAQPQEVKRFINLNEAYKVGFEVDIAWSFWNNFEFSTMLAYVYTKNEDLDESLPLTPPLTTEFKLGYEKKSFWINADYQVVARQNELAPSFGEVETDGYNVMNLRAGFDLKKNMNIGLAVLNIFDKTYNNHLNFSFVNQADFGRVPINDPGRNISVFVQYRL
jgi:iron complex outermembrane receptor protein